MTTSDQNHKDRCRLDDYAALIAIDWADQSHAVALLPAPFEAEALETFELEHTPEALTDWISALQERFPEGRVAIALEQRKGALIHFLSGFDFIDLFPIEPATASNFRACFYPSGAKTDPVDAVLLLEILLKHHERLRRWKPQSPEVRQCAQYCQDRRTFVDQRASCLQQLKSALKLYYPLALKLFDNLGSPLATAFLKKWPTLEALQKARPATLRSFFHLHGSRSQARIEARLELIAAAKPLTSDSGIIEPLVLRVTSLLALIETSRHLIEKYDQLIAPLYRQLDQKQIFASFPGAGEVFAPRLAVLFGRDPERFQNAQELQVLTGAAPVTKKSGKMKIVSMRRAGSVFQRQTITEFARTSLAFSPWARAFYQLHLPNGTDDKKRTFTTLRKLGFKWLRILFQCWKEQRPYDEAQYLASLRRSNSPVWEQLQKMQAQA